MNLSRKNKTMIVTYAVYAVMCGGIIWQLSRYVPAMLGALSSGDETPFLST
jgi:hypothetical protein